MKIKFIILILIFIFSACAKKYKEKEKKLLNTCYGIFNLENMTCSNRKLSSDSTCYFEYELKGDTFLVQKDYKKLKFIRDKKQNIYFGQTSDIGRSGVLITNMYLSKDKINTESFGIRPNGDTCGIVIKSYTNKETLILIFGDLASPLKKDSLIKYRNLIDENKDPLNSSKFDNHVDEKITINFYSRKDTIFEFRHIKYREFRGIKNLEEKIYTPHTNLEVSFFDNFLYGIRHATY